MPTARNLHRTVVVAGKIYVFSGSAATGVSGAVEVYDPQTNTWTMKAPMTITWRWDFAAGAYNGKIYIAGGSNGINELSDFSVYDPATDTWGGAMNLPANIHGPIGAFLGNRFIIAGRLNSGIPQGWTYEFDFGANAWVGRANTTYPRYYGDAVALGGKLYYIGGFDSTNSVSSTIQVYDPGFRTLYLHEKN